MLISDDIKLNHCSINEQKSYCTLLFFIISDFIIFQALAQRIKCWVSLFLWFKWFKLKLKICKSILIVKFIEKMEYFKLSFFEITLLTNTFSFVSETTKITEKLMLFHFENKLKTLTTTPKNRKLKHKNELFGIKVPFLFWFHNTDNIINLLCNYQLLKEMKIGISSKTSIILINEESFKMFVSSERTILFGVAIAASLAFTIFSTNKTVEKAFAVTFKTWTFLALATFVIGLFQEIRVLELHFPNCLHSWGTTGCTIAAICTSTVDAFFSFLEAVAVEFETLWFFAFAARMGPRFTFAFFLISQVQRNWHKIHLIFQSGQSFRSLRGCLQWTALSRFLLLFYLFPENWIGFTIENRGKKSLTLPIRCSCYEWSNRK